MDISTDRTELESLQTEAKALVEQLDLLDGKLAGEKDEVRLKVLKDEHEQKTHEFEEIQGKVAKVRQRMQDKVAAARKDVLEEINQLTKSNVHGKDLRDYAETRNRERDERLELDIVRNYIVEGKSVSDCPTKLRRKMFGSVAYEQGRVCDAVKLPARAVQAIIGHNWVAQMGAAKDVMETYRDIEGKDSCSGTGDYSTMPYASQNAYMTAAASWTEYKRRLLDLPGEPAELVNRLTVVPAESGKAQWVRTVSTDAAEYAGVTAYWLTCEGDLKTATQVKFEEFDIDCFELQAYTEITDRALARSIVPIEQILNSKFKAAVDHAVEYAVLRGTGAGQPDGIIDVAGIHQVHRKCTGDVKCADFIELKYALRRQHRSGAMFVLQDDAAKDVEKARYGGTDCDCVTYCMDQNSILGYPYMATHRLPALGTDGDVLFGDFREYVLAVEQDIMLASSKVAGEMFRRNSTAFKVYMIVGGEVAQPRAFAQLVACTGDPGSCCCE